MIRLTERRGKTSLVNPARILYCDEEPTQEYRRVALTDNMWIEVMETLDEIEALIEKSVIKIQLFR